jgi:WD40 repeat protein
LSSCDDGENHFPRDVDLDTEHLYQELANMTLSGTDPKAFGNTGDDDNSTHVDSSATMDPFALDLEDIPSGTDGLPFYLWCQPCDVIGGGKEEQQEEDMTEEDFEPLDPSLPPFAGDEPQDEIESDLVRHAQQNHILELQKLYQASQRHRGGRSVSSNPHSDTEGIIRSDLYVDPLLNEEQSMMAPKEDEEDRRRWIAAQPWMEAFGVTLEENGDSNHNSSLTSNGPPAPTKDTLKACIGHKETIFGVSFSQDGKFVATASQDATINIWETATQKLLASLKGHNTAYECLRVCWASSTWSDDVLDREGRFFNILASAGADGMVKLWTSQDLSNTSAKQNEENGWKCEFELDHAKLLRRGIATTIDEAGNEVQAEDDKPQVYSLQFIDHWRVFSNMLKEHHCGHQKVSADKEEKNASSFSGRQDKNSFFMTSSDEFIHLWEVQGHPFDQQLQWEDKKIRLLQDHEIKLKEVMSLHFGSLEQYGYGVTACSVTGQGLKLPPPPKLVQSGLGGKAFGGERNPQNIVFVFDAAYNPTNGLLGVALSDGSLRLVNGRGVCISILTLPGSQSHLTSFSWDTNGRRLATCMATGHLITWSLNMDDDQEGNRHTVAMCTAIMERGHHARRPLFGTKFCGKDENLLVSWGVDGKLCLWDSRAQGNVYAPMAILKQDSGYQIYAVDVSERNVAIGGGGTEGSFIGIPLYLADLPDVETLEETFVVKEQSSALKKVDSPTPKKPKMEDEELEAPSILS